VLAQRGTRALVFRGDDGLDELTTTTTSAVWVVRDGEVEFEKLDPTVLGLPLVEPGALRGGGPDVNAEVVRRLVAGDRGPVRDAVLLNAAAALAAFDQRSARLHDALGAGLARAAAAIDDGRAAAKLDEWVRVSQQARTTSAP
jgi:anthranilate phosphoribosyltransferase